MNDRIAVLQRRLKDAACRRDPRVHLLQDRVQGFRVTLRESAHKQAGFELQVDVYLSRLGDPHRVRQRVGLRDGVGGVFKRYSESLFED
jgi:hypothetical protein